MAHKWSHVGLLAGIIVVAFHIFHPALAEPPEPHPTALQSLLADRPFEAWPAARQLPFEVAQACCKHCKKGQPCGDTCISRDKVCRVGPGCAIPQKLSVLIRSGRRNAR